VKESVILVNYRDQPVGTCEKAAAHRDALLHKAFSVFLFGGKKVLLQKRAAAKNICGGLWSNTCCSHPASGEQTYRAAVRRLHEEIGIMQENLTELFSFFYYYHFSNGLTEFECDHVFAGRYPPGAIPVIDPVEIDELKWIDIDELLNDMATHPQNYTPWLLICAPKVVDALKENRYNRR
jgi:isopentenyl-diphosphate delta-isomerase